MTGPVPLPSPETQPYWDAAARGELQLQRCSPCREFYFYPRPFCPKCQSDDVHWASVSGNARLVSYVINRRPLPPFDPDAPIVQALVELQEGPILMSNIVGVEPDPAALQLGMSLAVQFIERGDQSLPVFAPTGEEN